MTLDPELSALMTQSARVYPWASDSVYGAPSYSATATTHPCRIVRKSRMVKDSKGRDTLATTTVYLGPSSTGGMPNLTPRDKLILSDGSTAQLLMVAKHVDEDGSGHHEVAYCG